MPVQHGGDGKFSTALTPALHKRIVEGVKRGLFDAQNAIKNGIDVTTLQSWVYRGIDEEAEEPFKSFAEDYLKAAISLEENCVGTILRACEPFDLRKESTETTRGRLEDDADCDSSDESPEPVRQTKTKKEVAKLRGDWKAAGWYLERRWPLRWGITRQPEGGPKEAIRLPDASQNRRRRVREMTERPPPELVLALKNAGYELVKREEPKP